MIPLVFVHGFMGGSEQWQAQSALTKDRQGCDRELIQVDLPGFGKNAHLHPVNSISGFSDWVLSELTRRGVYRFDLLGHSMGGMIVQEMARSAPERIVKLILYGTGATGVLPGRFEPIETSMLRAQRDGAVATARRISATWFLHNKASTEYSSCAAIAEQSSLAAILAGLEAMRDWSGEDLLQDIAANTFILWGDCDRSYQWSQVERLWCKIPNAKQLVIFPGCAHAVHLEAPQLFNKLVGEIIDG